MASSREFVPLMSLIDQIANGNPPSPNVPMRYEILRFCTLRNCRRENMPFLIRLAEAGFCHGSSVFCYCCGFRRNNWTAKDKPMQIHQRNMQNYPYLRKNSEVNQPVQHFGPYDKGLTALMDIPECSAQSENVSNASDFSTAAPPSYEVSETSNNLTGQEHILLSGATLCMMEMGFQQEIVLRTIEHVRESGYENVTYQILLETAEMIHTEMQLPSPNLP